MTPDNRIVGANGFIILGAGESLPTGVIAFAFVPTEATAFTTLKDGGVAHVNESDSFLAGYYYPASRGFDTITVNTGSIIVYIESE